MNIGDMLARHGKYTLSNLYLHFFSLHVDIYSYTASQLSRLAHGPAREL